MDWVHLFIIRYFVLLCASAVLFVTSIQHRKQYPRMSQCIIMIASLTLFLAVFNVLEDYGKAIGNIPLATAFAFLRYIIHPCCVYLFILMSDDSIQTKKGYLISILPLAVNFIIYLFAFIPVTKEAIFYFYVNDAGTLSFGGGIIRYAAHLIGAGYLGYLIFVAIKNLGAKHFSHSLVILFCALFVVLAVVIETFLNANGDVYLLNSTIGVAALTYYLHLYTERSQLDGLTGLYNRSTYYRDLPGMEKSATGLIMFDLNGLKHLNDTQGHLEGDKALATVGSIILKVIQKDMYAYRLGGDEFLVIVNGSGETQIQSAIVNFKIRLAETPYFCSVGYHYRLNRSMSINDMIKEAETQMYEEKELFYRNSSFDRRQS